MIADVNETIVHSRGAGNDTIRGRMRHCVPHVRATRRGTLGSRTNLPEAMIQGRFSIGERWDRDGMGFFVLVWNPRTDRPLRRLLPREAAIVRVAARGVSLKQISVELGIADTIVCRTLKSALRKIGLRSQGELVLAFHALGAIGDESQTTVSAARATKHTVILAQDLRVRLGSFNLTSAEKSIAPLLAAGIEDRTIAAVRGVGLRTIATQAGSIYRKMNVSSRAELAAALARPKTALF